jgi:predicted alpha/beta superfamily hydrolase
LKYFRYITFIALLLPFLWSCKSESTPKENSVTIILESVSAVPDNRSVFISGNFEGWSGGNDSYVLEKKGKTHQINLPDSLGRLEFKFTLGGWETVEKDKNGNDMTNRTYQFSKPNDTLLVTVESWANGKNSKPLLPPENVNILSDSIYMPQLKRHRRIWVYTPPNYSSSSETYPVVYMHDGQNLFMEETSGFGEWKVDETLNALSKYHDLEAIVVGVDHGGKYRTSELSPYNYKYAEQPEGDQYIDFIVNTLKPKIDSTYRTKTDRTNTAILGSSLGGLISHYAGIKSPETFGKIGVFSPSYWVSDDIYSQIEANDTKIYMLAGKAEGYSLLEDAQKMKKVLLQNGFNQNNFYYKEVEGGKHNEIFWSASLSEALCWLFDIPIPQKNPLLKDLQLKPQSDIQLSAGTIQRIEDFPSKYIKSRPIDVWLPENYSADNQYSVLYMHDGQMLFDATTTWNKQEWRVDEWASKLMNEDKVEDFIVVAIHNIPEIRWQDLFPEKAYSYLSEAEKALAKDRNGNQNFSLNGDNYLRFLVNELKPFIDSGFSTNSEKEHTFVMGSSMGGLMSMYAISEYPEVFGGAACLSTHWVGAQPIEDNPLPDAIFNYMADHLPHAGTHKLYFDYGDKTLDAHYPQYAPRVDIILNEKGYSDMDSRNLFFEGTNHSENAWNKRLDQPLEFLLGKK